VVVGRVRDRCHVLLRQSLVLLRHQPRNRHMRDVEAPGDFRQRFPAASPKPSLNGKRPPSTMGPARLEFQSFSALAFIVDLVGFFLPLSFSPGSCAREEGFMVRLIINKDGP